MTLLSLGYRVRPLGQSAPMFALLDCQKIKIRIRMIRMSVPIPMYIECLLFVRGAGCSLSRWFQTSWSVASDTKAASAFM